MISSLTRQKQQRRARKITSAKSRQVPVMLTLLLLFGLAVVASVLIGTRTIGVGVFADFLLKRPVPDMEAAIIDQRLVRTLWAATIGAALALAGAGMQGVTRNPLGDPGILGVNSGAAFAVVFGIAFLGMESPASFAILAFVGAAVTSVLVYALASIGRDGATPVKLALMGAAISAGLGSFTSAFILQFSDALDSLRMWQLGTVAGASMENFFPGIFMLIAGALILVFSSKTINNFALGDDMAASLGENVALKRFIIFIGITLLCGTATSMTGPIAFLGLMAPHALRALVGPDYRLIIPLSAVFGAVLLMVADTVGRVIMPPEEVQVGVTMVLVGVPVFLYLVRFQKAVDL
ncbi:FecCD family ABC transporter permease [Rothia terrae]|uniref:FecCD family ABC transporter permease n=1 Tax=Rothia terrae TaxID=396015 RepID=UPI001B35233F|nr:iron ABC transporter permease [Rothia terrae]MDT0190496.1 iron ABC transporter permease [Rothia terrae]